ncbi:F-box only protein 41 [Mactra antiquata]
MEIEDRIPLHKREQVKLRRSALVCTFSFLNTRTLTVVAQVCREWRIVSRSPKLWRRVVLRDEKVSNQFLRRISRRCGQLGVLILENLHPRTRSNTETVEEYQSNIRCSLENGYEQILKKAEATIHTIEVINCGTLLSAKCLWVASCCCRMLKHVTYLSNFDPINTEVMWALGSGCRDLKTLRCQPLLPCARETNFTTRCSLMIGQCFKDLEILSLGGISVDISTLIYIGKQCQKLSTIELHRMQFLTCEVIDEMCQNGLKNLKCLCLYTTPIAPGALTILHAYCKYLDRLIIRLTEADFETCKEQQSDSTLPDYNEIVDGYEVLRKQPQFIKNMILDVETPSKYIKKETVEKPEKETSFFERWFK